MSSSELDGDTLEKSEDGDTTECRVDSITPSYAPDRIFGGALDLISGKDTDRIEEPVEDERCLPRGAFSLMPYGGPAMQEVFEENCTSPLVVRVFSIRERRFVIMPSSIAESDSMRVRGPDEAQEVE